MSSFIEQRDRVVRLCTETERLARSGEDVTAAGEVVEARGRLQQGRITVAALGAFCRGKSMLLNALLDEPDLFPVDATISTCVVTAASFAASERVTARIDGEDEIRILTRAQIAEYVTEERNRDNAREVCVLTVELPSEKLRDGLVVVDTPGVGSVERRHTVVTYTFLAQADVALFVIDALSPLTTEELDLLRVVHQQCQALVVAITKIDKEPDFARIVANTRDKLIAVLGEEGGSRVPVVPVSSTQKLAHLRSGTARSLESSNFPALERELWNVFGTRRAAMLLLRPLGVLSRVVDGLLGPIESELEVYAADSEAALARHDEQLRADKERLDRLRAGEASWRRSLQRQMQDARMDMEFQARRGASAVRARLQTALSDPVKLEKPEEIAAGVESDLALLGSELSRRLEAALADAAKATAEDTGVDMNAALPGVAIAAEAEVPSLSDLKFEEIMGLVWLRGASSLRMGGAMAGAAVVALGVSGIGLLAAGAMAFGAVQLGRAGVKEQRMRTQQEHRMEILKHLTPPLDEALQQIEQEVRLSVAHGERRLADEFDERITHEQRRLLESSAAANAARRRSGEEARARQAELRDPLAQLKRLRGEIAHAAEVAVEAVLPVLESEPPEIEPERRRETPREVDDETAGVVEVTDVVEPEATDAVGFEDVAEFETSGVHEVVELVHMDEVDRGAWADVAAPTAPVVRTPRTPDRGEWAEV